MITSGFRHRDTCPQDTPVRGFMGKQGDPMRRCPTCHAIGTATAVASRVESPPALAQRPPEAPPEPLPMLPRYVCGEHPDKYVDGRGRGCPECSRLARRSRRP